MWSRVARVRLLRSAGVRLAMLYLAVFVASILVLGAAVYGATRIALRDEMASRIQTEAAFLAGEYHGGGLPRLLQAVRSRGRGASALDYAVVGPDGRALAGEMTDVSAALTRAGWQDIPIPHTTEDGGRSERVRALVSPLGTGLWLAVGDDLGRIEEIEETIASAFGLTAGLVVLLGIGGGVLLSRAFLARVEAIGRTAEAIIGGDMARRIPVRDSGDDLDRLAMTLNRMLDRIGVLMDSLRQVSSDVAHDLRTPLSRLYQRLEHARTHATTIADYDRATEGALREAEELLGIFAALLRIAQVEGADARATMRPIALSAVVEAVADAYRPDAEDAGHVLRADIAAGVSVCGDQELLTQVAANLVENALRHTPPGSRIEVALVHVAPGSVRFSVADDGPGVVPDDLARLTRRFYRAERSRTTPGHGLGLSLVAAVADLHGASLIVRSNDPGLRVAIDFPSAVAVVGASVTSTSVPSCATKRCSE